MYLVEREEVRGEGLKEQSLIAQPHLLVEVDVSVIEVLAKCVHDLLKVGLDKLSQVLNAHAGGQDVALSLHQTPVAAAILWTGAARKTISHTVGRYMKWYVFLFSFNIKPIPSFPSLATMKHLQYG